MRIRFKSFHDCNSYANKFICATTQVEEFIEENNIEITNIKDIKFSVDDRGREHILLVYLEETNNEEV